MDRRGVVAVLLLAVAAGLLLWTMAIRFAEAGGISPTMQRDILGAGMQASHRSLQSALETGSCGGPCEKMIRRAIQQMEASSRDAGIKLKDE
jgi:hypothetical protein